MVAHAFKSSSYKAETGELGTQKSSLAIKAMKFEAILDTHELAF